MPSTKTPPTAPPTMAPTGVSVCGFPGGIGVGVGVGIVVGVGVDVDDWVVTASVSSKLYQFE